jgi:uncharacterized membrane protein
MSTAITRTEIPMSQSMSKWLARHWYEVFLAIYGLWVLLPFLAPMLINMGWTGTAKGLYFFYSFFCHQLPERSLFLFGQKTMYSLNEIQAAWQSTTDPLTLRKFIGNEIMGWKIAWSDRMISFYTSIWLFALILSPFRRKIKPLAVWGLILLLLPIVIDGGTHMLSEPAGIGHGFRDTNQWLAAITNNVLPASFYAGDLIGSFNSWMRLITGVLAGLGITWFVVPYIFNVELPTKEPYKLEGEF